MAHATNPSLCDRMENPATSGASEVPAGAFVLGVDLDGVNGDYTKYFRTVVAAELGLDEHTIGDQLTWNFSGTPSWGIRDYEHFLELHRIAVADYNMFANMEEIPGASDALWELSDAGVYIRIITHRLTVNWGHQQAVGDTVAWLQAPRSDGRPRTPYRDICFVAQKAEVGADLYIDDAPHNVLSLRAAGREVVCFDAPYNRDIGGLRADNWGDVVDIVLERAANKKRSSALIA